VQHPHILSVYEADQAEGNYFYTHEYVDGFTLASASRRRCRRSNMSRRDSPTCTITRSRTRFPMRRTSTSELTGCRISRMSRCPRRTCLRCKRKSAPWDG
jgi:serine/threonine protein kinase